MTLSATRTPARFTHDDVLDGGRARRDDVDVDLEARSGHPDGRADAVLLVHHEVLRQHVEDLAAVRQRTAFAASIARRTSSRVISRLCRRPRSRRGC